VIVGVYEYNTKRDPEKRPYEHSNHSDETLVDPNHESIKSHEARSVPCVQLRHSTDPPHRFKILRIRLQLNTRLHLQASARITTFNSTRLRHPLRHLLAVVTYQERDSNHPRVELSSSRIVRRPTRKHLPHSPCCPQMFWVLPSGSSRYRKLLNRFWNVCNLVNRCITYLFVWFVTPVVKIEDYVVLYLIGWCSSFCLSTWICMASSPLYSPRL